MPGRGQPWKVGGLKDNTVTSDDIKQGTIKQEDIDPAYQAIIEGGGGGGGEPSSGLPSRQYFHDQFCDVSPVSPLTNWFVTGDGINSVEIADGLGVVGIDTNTNPDDTASLRSKFVIDSGKENEITFRVELNSNDNAQAVRVGLIYSGASLPEGTFPFGTLPAVYCWFGFDSDGSPATVWFVENSNGG